MAYNSSMLKIAVKLTYAAHSLTWCVQYDIKIIYTYICYDVVYVYSTDSHECVNAVHNQDRAAIQTVTLDMKNMHGSEVSFLWECVHENELQAVWQPIKLSALALQYCRNTAYKTATIWRSYFVVLYCEKFRKIISMFPPLIPGIYKLHDNIYGRLLIGVNEPINKR